MSRTVLTSELSRLQLVVLAVYHLGGAEHPVDTEDVAIEAHRLAPGRFSWRKHPDQINLELVRVSLSDAKKRSKGELVSGSGRKGWVVTRDGLRWAKATLPSLRRHAVTSSSEPSGVGPLADARWRRERARIFATDAWRRWLAGRRTPLNRRHAAEVFRIDSYATPATQETKVTRLLALFQDDTDVAPFLDRLAGLVEGKEAK